MEQLAHAVAESHVAAFPPGLQAAIESPDGGVASDGDPGGIPEVGPGQVVALLAHGHRAGGQGMTLLVDTGAVLLRENAEVADQVVGRREPSDVYDLGDQDRGRGLADARDRSGP